MYTLSITQAIPIALLLLCPMAAQPGSTSTGGLYGSHRLMTSYGRIDIEVSKASDHQRSYIAVGQQYILTKNAPLIRILQLMDRPIAPCPLTAYDFGPPIDRESPSGGETVLASTKLAEQVNFKISCSDCQLFHLQEVASRFLYAKIKQEELVLSELAIQPSEDQTNR